MSRPTVFTDNDKLECMVIICEQIATSSKSLRKILGDDENLPSVSELYRWFNEPEIGFRLRELYARAKEDQADFLAEEIMEIADDSSNDTTITDFGAQENKEWVNRSKLRVDTRKWIAAHLKPKRYGEKLELDGKLQTNQHFSPEQFSQILQAAKDNSQA